MPISPTAEGFRAAFRRPLLTFAEITWRWTVGATAAAVFFFGLFEYLNTLPVTRGERLLLRTRHPSLVAEAIAHILRGTGRRAAIAAILAVLLVVLLWMIAASLGRIATVGYLLDYFRGDVAGNVSAGSPASDPAPFRALLRINFLRAAVTLAAVFGLMGALILAGFASPVAPPHPGLTFLLFLPLAGLVCFAWWALNWLLSLAGIFAVRDGEDAPAAISAAVTFCRERTGPVFAVSIWTWLAHLVAFVLATTVIAIPLPVLAVVPWRLTVVGVTLVTLAYFAVVDWLYVARLAGYVCIAQMPEALLAPARPAPPLAVATTIDRNEPILSDVPGAMPAPS